MVETSSYQRTLVLRNDLKWPRLEGNKITMNTKP